MFTVKTPENDVTIAVFNDDVKHALLAEVYKLISSDTVSNILKDKIPK